ncbi:MAG: hypothetical protein KF833_11595 [Verrucomicrobiae bacterium]|nr:hypothetical protein [Verrucomicrobiae bacterium]
MTQGNPRLANDPSQPRNSHPLPASLFALATSLVALPAFLPPLGAATPATAAAQSLTLDFQPPHWLVIHAPHVPGREIRINHLEAYCRNHSTDADWVRHTVIPHRVERLELSDDRRQLRLRDTLADGVIVEHTITAGPNEVDFRLTARNPTDTRSEAHWAQPCVRLGDFTGFPDRGGDLEDYLPKCFIFLNGQLTRLPDVRPWATHARYVPGQVWCPTGVPRTDINPRPLSPLVPDHGLIGAFSSDEQWIFATAWEPWQELFQGVARCLHSDFRLGGLLPGQSLDVRGKIYLVPNNVPALLARYAADFPEHRVSPFAARGLTTLSDPAIPYTVPDRPYTILRRADIEAVIVDNRAVDDEILPGHAAGYHGVASLRHTRQPRNLFVPAYSGLNFEHIHDGTVQPLDILFEPRRAPMQLRVLGPHTAELHQPPTPFWGLESAMRYHLLEDGTLELTFECIPRRDTFRNGYLGLFWASYIHLPESLDIHFRGAPSEHPMLAGWQRGVTPAHGTLATHRGLADPRDFPHHPDFPLTLPFGFSNLRYAEPWYYGISRGMAFLQMFRPEDRVWITQSPSGGGRGCPAWDFQWFIPQPRIGQLYRLTMRAAYLPLDRPDDPEAIHEQILRTVLTRRPLSSPLP